MDYNGDLATFDEFQNSGTLSADQEYVGDQNGQAFYQTPSQNGNNFEYTLYKYLSKKHLLIDSSKF